MPLSLTLTGIVGWNVVVLLGCVGVLGHGKCQLFGGPDHTIAAKLHVSRTYQGFPQSVQFFLCFDFEGSQRAGIAAPIYLWVVLD